MPQPGSSKLDNLKAERVSAGLSVMELAKAANVSERTIYVLEDGGEEELHIVTRIADALGVTLVTLGQRVM